MRQVWRRCGGVVLLAIGLTGVSVVPAMAKDTYAFYGPLEVRIVGANGGLEDFVALSAEDRRGAAALVNQIAGAMRAPAQPTDNAPGTRPYYQIGVSHLGLTYVTTPWARMSQTSFLYYPGASGAGFLMVVFSRGGSVREQRWVLPSPEVAALLQRHLQGLSPIGIEPAGGNPATDSWALALGAVLLAVVSLMLFEDRRRWRLRAQRRSAGKGT